WTCARAVAGGSWLRVVAAGRGGVPHQAYRYGRAVPEGSCWTGRGAGSWRRVVVPYRGAGAWRRVVAAGRGAVSWRRVVAPDRGAGSWCRIVAPGRGAGSWRRVVAVPGVVATHERVVFGGDWTEFGSKATFSTHWRVKGAAQRV